MRSFLSLLAVFCALCMGNAPSAFAQSPPIRHVAITATTPHRADGVDRSEVTVFVTDVLGRPVPNARIYISAVLPTLSHRIGHIAVYLKARNDGGGVYRAAFPCGLPTTLLVRAIDTISDAEASTFVEFLPLGPPIRKSGIRPQGDTEDCQAMFDDIDDATLPSKAAPDVKAAEEKVVPFLQELVALEKNKATTTKDITDKIKKDGKALKKEIALISKIHMDIFKKRVPDGKGGIDFAKLDNCFRMFANFELVKKFDDPVRGVVDGPNSPEFFLLWPKFAELAIFTDTDADSWKILLKSLIKGVLIYKEVLVNQNNDKKTDPTAKPKPLKPERVKEISDEVDKSDTTEKLIEKLQKEVQDYKDKGLIAMVRPIESRSGLRLTAILTNQFSTTGQTLPVANLMARLQMTQEDGVLFGYGVDSFGLPYAIAGTVNGSQASFTLSGPSYLAGFGTAVEDGSALTVFEGTLTPGRLTGTFQGSTNGFLHGLQGHTEWSGTFVLENRSDTNKDGKVDQTDLNFVAARLGSHQGDARYDPRADMDSNGLIDLTDLQCVSQNFGRNFGPF